MSLDMTAVYAALANKIGVEASEASAEELAFLGTALERIGGRSSVIEVQALANAAKSEIIDLRDSVLAHIDAQLNDVIQDEIDKRRSDALNQVDAHITDATEAVTTLKTNVDTQIEKTQTAIDTTAKQAVADIITAIDKASSAVTGINHVTYFMGQIG